ncbi:MAG: flagellar biosynthesis protein FlhB [Planctomycetaceae bacterium]|nr:flagellar biosynthesis protein FlhB [Planctomycetaceae bacterium]
MPEQNGDKTHEPTQRRRDQARQQGQVARSQDLASSVVLLVSFILLMTVGKQITELFLTYSHETIRETPWLDGDFQTIIPFLQNSTFRFMLPVSILFLLLMAAGVLVNYFQVGWIFSPEKLGFDFKRIDPIQGFTRIFSLQSAMRLFFGLMKIFICAGVAYSCVKGEINHILELIAVTEVSITGYTLNLLLWTGLKIAACLVILALLDYMYQWWKHEQDLKMTTQEIRDEMKETMGDPQIMSKRRQIQRQMAQQRMAESVPSADVVVTNPTELAIALKYDPDTMQAPVVVAKGAGFTAKKIRQLALESGIPIIERKPLAQALFRHVEINQPIPAEHFTAVAEILAYVYQLKGKTLTPT